MSAIRYEVVGYHQETRQRRKVATFDSYQDATNAVDAIETMIKQIVQDSDIHDKDAMPWDISIVDHQDFGGK